MDLRDLKNLSHTLPNTEDRISTREAVGGGYDEFWKSTQRYVVCKGSRASKKSTTAALKLIVRLMQMPLANALVVRQTQATLKDSCYAQLQWAINRLGVDKFWKATVNPLQLTYIPTGQKIIFRGCDDAEKIKSITVSKGFICFAWLEEASEVDFDEFDKIDKSLRAQMPEGYYIQWLITFNPTSANSWLKSFFFDTPRDNVLAMTTTYKCNEWLSDEFLELMEYTRKTDPDRYKVDGLGEWGLGGGQYFSMWRESLHVVKPFKIPQDWLKFRAMDFGQARPYAVLWLAVDYDGDMYVYRELYGWGGKPNVGTGETAKQIAEKIVELELPSENVSYGVLDSACWARTGVTAPSIEEEINRVLIRKGLVPFIPSSKGRLEGANAFKQRLIGNQLEDESYKPAIKFFSTCVHCIRTIPMIGHDKHKPELPDTNAEDHCFVAGTLIQTARGEIPIEEVTTDDRVLTRQGFRKVLVSGITKRKARVMTLTFSNGQSVTGTPNHPIFIKGRGFTRLDAVSYGDIIYSASEVIKPCRENNWRQRNQSYSTALLSDGTRTQKRAPTEIITAQTAGSTIKGLSTCIGKCGNSITAKSPTAITFTTRTATLLTTIFLILSCLKSSFIFHHTREKICRQKADTRERRNTWKQFAQKLSSGTVPKKGANGTDSTALNAQNVKQKSRKLNSCVSNAVKNFTHRATGETAVSIAQTLVVPNIGATTALTTKHEPALFAGKSSELIGFRKQRLAVGNAPVTLVERHEEKRKADVYNLTVDEEHEYFANGFLVHNCYDAVAYACTSRPWIPVKRGAEDYGRERRRVAESRRSPWTY